MWRLDELADAAEQWRSLAENIRQSSYENDEAKRLLCEYAADLDHQAALLEEQMAVLDEENRIAEEHC